MRKVKSIFNWTVRSRTFFVVYLGILLLVGLLFSIRYNIMSGQDMKYPTENSRSDAEWKKFLLHNSIMF